MKFIVAIVLKTIVIIPFDTSPFFFFWYILFIFNSGVDNQEEYISSEASPQSKKRCIGKLN